MSFFEQLRQLAGRVERDLSQLKDDKDLLLTGIQESSGSGVLILLEHQKALKELQKDVGCLKEKVNKASEFSQVMEACVALVDDRKAALNEVIQHLSKYGYKGQGANETPDEAETEEQDEGHGDDSVNQDNSSFPSSAAAVTSQVCLERTPQLEDFLTQDDVRRLKAQSVIKSLQSGARPAQGSVTPPNSTWTHGAYPQASPKLYSYESVESDVTPYLSKRSKKPAVMLEDSPVCPQLSCSKYSHRGKSKEDVSSERKSPRGKKLRKGGGEEMASMTQNASVAQVSSLPTSLTTAFASLPSGSPSTPKTPDLTLFSFKKQVPSPVVPAPFNPCDTPETPELTMRYDKPHDAPPEMSPLDLSRSQSRFPELSLNQPSPPPAHCKPPPKALDLSMTPEITGVVPLNWNQCDDKENKIPENAPDFLERPSSRRLISPLSSAEYSGLPDYIQRLLPFDSLNRCVANLNLSLNNENQVHLDDIQREMPQMASVFEFVMTNTGRLQKLHSRHGSSPSFRVI
ncbi:hypothetical protein CAPTEDRAFT_219069 [Capitella teleta]|uniref:Spindle and kinetochore-associated protein 3 n=1 Tax=Capitella teleta TaxID=283909 RepID=R7VH86_CAPTE|nr:hypothetical protein CAPTEDRAFT_219069 [Capitella teleta]|eukprot:ELU17942.1 hypothetical protein CAPTEDRAFT_219069 [Capitella teleta]